MSKRTTAMRNHQTQSGTKESRIPKVVLTQTLATEENNFIVSQTRFTDTPIVSGRLINYEVPNSFAVFGGMSTELIDSHVVSSTSAAMIVTIVLEGRLTFGYDDVEFRLDGDQQPEAVLVNLTQAASFHRSIEKYNQLLKINLLFHSSWVQARLGNIAQQLAFANQHLGYLRIPVSPQLHRLALEIIQCEQPQDFRSRLKLESCTLNILEALIAHTPQMALHPASSGANTSAPSRVEEVLNYIEQHLKQTLNIDLIADHFSMSSSNLQRVFRQHVGVTISSYIRQRRLRLAKQNLEKGLMTITEAAYEAGYNHPANFTIAFKKTFGVPPTKVVKT